MKAKTFKDAYGVLQRNAQTLREQEEPNIDDLLAIVTESAAAYKLCQERIAAVEQALEKALGSEAAEPGARPAAKPERGAPAAGSAQQAGWDAEDDGDVPF